MRLVTRVIKRIEAGERTANLQAQAKCPDCGIWGDVDDEQLAGTVSLICACEWHGYIDGREA
jgi:hypothetical protein